MYTRRPAGSLVSRTNALGQKPHSNGTHSTKSSARTPTAGSPPTPTISPTISPTPRPRRDGYHLSVRPGGSPTVGER
ncbi:hypothetical protein ACIRP0_25485 [Streptomyces sp. NPDC101733]|uniref:hypothetical protein n=1 Tax=unclassified Streptomyces TaxID=2593676 RepID=UPI00382963FB